MEREVIIKIPKTNKVIFGRLRPAPSGAGLRGSSKRPLVLLVHGWHSTIDNPMYYNMARFLERNGFASFRFGLYGSRPNQRTLHHTTLKIHAQDVNTVVRYFHRKGIKRLAAVGHSYGGPTVFLSDTSVFFAIILLDPSYKVQFRKRKHARWVKELNAYLVRGRDHFLMGKGMLEESERLHWDDLTRDITAPMLFLMAGKGTLQKAMGPYMQHAKGPVQKVIIPGAGHMFAEDGRQEQVFANTLRWLKKYA